MLKAMNIIVVASSTWFPSRSRTACPNPGAWADPVTWATGGIASLIRASASAEAA